MTILSGFDVEQLEHIMGFDNKERCCQVMAIGELSERKAQRMERPLMHVLPTDYSEPVPKLPRARPEEGLGNAGFFLPESVGRQGLHALLQRRRSAREFAPLPIREGLVEQFMNIFGKMKYCSAAFVVLRAEDHRSGIYREKEPLQKGFFDREVAALLVNQRFVASAGAVIVVHTKQPGPSAHLEAGMAAQGCYLLAEASGMGCSGIGAYYDDALRSFLTLDDEVVYAIAIGARDENRDT
jgi:nitroreductase